MRELNKNPSCERRFRTTELAKRAVACSGWRWLPGMLATLDDGGSWMRIMAPQRRMHGDWKFALPDLTDPATLGCLLSLVREAWGEPKVWVEGGPNGDEWRVWRWLDGGVVCLACGPTEAAALVAALEAKNDRP